MIGALARTTLRVALTVMGVLLVLIALLTIGMRLALPYVASKKTVVEARVGEYLDRPVAIGELDLAWQAGGPQLRLEGVSVRESATRAVRFDELRVDVDLLSSLWQRAPVVDELTLVGADLTIEYAGDGHFRLQGVERGAYVPGMAGNGAADAGPAPADDSDASGDAGAAASGEDGLDVLRWLLAAGRVGLLDTRVTMIDEFNDRRLVFSELNVRAENADELHRLRVDLVLPPELGDTFELGVDLEGPISNPQAFEGSIYARGNGLQIGGWRSLREIVPAGASGSVGGSSAAAGGNSSISGLSTDPEEDRAAESAPTGTLLDALIASSKRVDGQAQVELWGTWRDGEIASARSRVDARDMQLMSDGEALPLLDGLSADVAYRDDEPGWTLDADRVELVAGSERAVLDNVAISRRAGGEDTWQFQAAGQYLPLALAAHLPRAMFADAGDPDGAIKGALKGAVKGRVSVPAARHLSTALAALDPSGRLRDWRVDARLQDDRPLLSVTGDVEAVSFAPYGGLPGVDLLSGAIRMDDSRGSLTVAGQNFTVTRGAAEVAIDRLDAAFDVDMIEPGQSRLDGEASFVRESAEATARIGVRLDADQSPAVDVQANYKVDDVKDVPPLLSVAGLPAPVTDWFERALVAGRAEQGTLTWVGQLKDFPHANGDGKLQAGFDLVDGTLAFLPDWPVAVIPRGRVELDGVTLSGQAAYGRMGELDVASASTRIDNLLKPRLAFESAGRAPLESLIRFGRSGPLRDILGAVLADTSGTGTAGMDVALEVPLARGAGGPLSVDGALFLDGNDVTFDVAELTLDAARGSIGFDENGVRISNLRASLFDRPVSIDGASSGTGDSAVTELRLEGAMEASDVLSHYGIPLDRFVSGSSNWSVTLSAPHSSRRIREEGVRLLASSDLVGTSLLLPAPLSKASGIPRLLTLTSAFREGEELTQWRVEHGDARLRAAINTDAAGLFSFGARLGEGRVTAPLEPGFRLDGRAPRLAFDAWAEAFSTLIEDLPDGDDGPALIPAIHAELAIDELVAGVQSLGPASLRVTTDENYVNAVVNNAHVAGSVRYPRVHWERERVARVRLTRIDNAVVDALASAPEGDVPDALDPRTLPAIDAHVSSFAWNAIELEGVTFAVRPDPRGITFDFWSTVEGTQLTGEGGWLLRSADEAVPERAGRHASTLAMQVAGGDLGEGLDAIGLPGVLAEGSGEIEAALGWEGPLYSPAIERTRGTMSFDIERGRIVPLEPGAGRLVGLFALQALPRRLKFDFRDLTSEGLAFERVNGDVSLAAGVANVNLMQLTGPIGVVDVMGTSDIVRREYDQRITVLPRVSSALPIIGAIAGGASGGIGALVASGFLKALGLDFDKIGLRRFSLKGSWDDPALEPIDGSTAERD